MPEYESNKKIKKVYKGKSGTSEYGPWQAWNFYLEGIADKKFSYFSGDKKPEPIEGRMVKHVEYETVTKGGYTNHNVKALVYYPRENGSAPDNETRQDPPDPGQADYDEHGYPAKSSGEPTSTPEPSEPKTPFDPDPEPKSDPFLDGKLLNTCLMSAKDITVALIETGKWNEAHDLEEIAVKVVDIGKGMVRRVSNGS